MKEFNPLILKKPYRTPQLVVYGNLAEITRSITGTVNSDGGPVIGMMKTG